jgi:conjugal transfer pilus assembly protein TraK
VYIRPVGTSSKPINLFISSATATYTLVLRRSDIPADTIVLRDKTLRPSRQGANPLNQGPAGSASNHIRALKTMLVAMTTDRVPTDVRAEEVNIPKILWAEARFTQTRLYEGRDLIGEKYVLTNVSNETMVLTEQEFDREGGNVAAISVENLNLRPGESTNVYVIRLGD